MQRYSDEELTRLLSDLESDLVERKESFSGETPKRARETVCAFANDLPGHNRSGVLFIGVKDDGTPSGLHISDRLLLTLSDMETDGNIRPFPVITVEKRNLKGAEIAVVTVLPSDSTPVKYDGRIWIRIGPRRAIANEQEERIVIEKRQSRQIPFDLRPVFRAVIDDLSRVFFEEEYLPKAVSPEILTANKNIADVLKTIGVIQRFGLGLRLARDAMAANGNPPIEFEVDSGFVRCVLQKRQAKKTQTPAA